MSLNTGEWSDASSEDELWGRGYQWHHDQLVAASVYSLALVLEVGTPHNRAAQMETGRELSTSIDDWCGRLVDWLQVSTDLDLDPHEPAHAHANRFLTFATRIWYVEAPGGRTWFPVNPKTIVAMTTSAEKAISKRKWKRAVAAANSENRPPDEHLLLRDARFHLRRGRTRFAVLNAATAAEMAIGVAVRQRLESGLGVEPTSRILKQLSQISRLIPLLESLGVAILPSTQQDLFALRNRVIHRNEIPTNNEAAKAVEIARGVLLECVGPPEAPNR